MTTTTWTPEDLAACRAAAEPGGAAHVDGHEWGIINEPAVFLFRDDDSTMAGEVISGGKWFVYGGHVATEPTENGTTSSQLAAMKIVAVIVRDRLGLADPVDVRLSLRGEWLDFDGLQHEMAKALGIVDSSKPWFDVKGIFWSRNPISSVLTKIQAELVAAKFIEENSEGLYRWTSGEDAIEPSEDAITAILRTHISTLETTIAELEARDVVEVTEEMRLSIDMSLASRAIDKIYKSSGASADTLKAATDLIDEIITQRAARAKEKA